MNWGSSAAVGFLSCALAACGQAPIKPAATHIKAEEAGPQGTIPPPVQVTPLLPKPKAAVRPETYSVVVNNVRAQAADGSWYVRSRAPKFQPYFQSGFPHDHDQWISAAATSWATAAARSGGASSWSATKAGTSGGCRLLGRAPGSLRMR